MKILSITPPKETDKIFAQLQRVENMEKVKSLELIAYHDSKFKTLALARWYQSRNTNASITYCVVRLTSYLMPIELNDQYIFAINKDDHLGQDRILYSFNKAIKSAGVKFDNGNHSIEEPETIFEFLARENYNNYENLHFARG